LITVVDKHLDHLRIPTSLNSECIWRRLIFRCRVNGNPLLCSLKDFDREVVEETRVEQMFVSAVDRCQCRQGSFIYWINIWNFIYHEM